MPNPRHPLSRSSASTRSRRRNAIRLLFVSLLSVATYSGTVRTAAGTAAVTVDPSAHVAGEPVTITGHDFVAGESVTVQVTHADGTAEPGMGHAPSTLTVSPDGTFQTSWTSSAEDLLGTHFVVVVSGDVSGA